MGWTVETLNETVDPEVEALPEDMRARLARIAKLIEEKAGDSRAQPRGSHATSAGPEERDHLACRRAARKRAGASFNAHAGASGQRCRVTSAHPFWAWRAGETGGGNGNGRRIKVCPHGR